MHGKAKQYLNPFVTFWSLASQCPNSTSAPNEEQPLHPFRKEGEEWDGVLGCGCYTHIFIHRT